MPNITREQIAERSQLIKKLIEEEKSKDAREIDPWHLLGLRCASDIYCNRMWRWEKNAAERAAKADRLAAELERERKTTELLREQTLDNEEKEVLRGSAGYLKPRKIVTGRNNPHHCKLLYTYVIFSILEKSLYGHYPPWFHGIKS